MTNDVSINEVDHALIIYNVKLKKKLTEPEYQEYMRIANLALAVINEMFKDDVEESSVVLGFAVERKSENEINDGKGSVVEFNKQRGNLKLVTGNNDGI